LDEMWDESSVVLKEQKLVDEWVGPLAIEMADWKVEEMVGRRVAHWVALMVGRRVRPMVGMMVASLVDGMVERMADLSDAMRVE